MTSYKTYLKWKPLIDNYKDSGLTRREFCRQEHINCCSFSIVLRNEKFGLIADPKSPSSHYRTRKAHRSSGKNKKPVFLKATVRKESDYESCV